MMGAGEHRVEKERERGGDGVRKMGKAQIIQGPEYHGKGLWFYYQGNKEPQENLK